VEPGQRIWYAIRMKATVRRMPLEQSKRGKNLVRWTVGVSPSEVEPTGRGVAPLPCLRHPSLVLRIGLRDRSLRPPPFAASGLLPRPSGVGAVRGDSRWKAVHGFVYPARELRREMTCVQVTSNDIRTAGAPHLTAPKIRIKNADLQPAKKKRYRTEEKDPVIRFPSRLFAPSSPVLLPCTRSPAGGSSGTGGWYR